ncbi:sulfite exporter TauE/SafE family protein [Lederbergia panacisoli]|uniref:sulfite exporter TauE/SafE family protein n=1 Tax=Lederbergia panacisoli TaxID=1255251 RepID=UPI00214D06CB|nr:sulfite exporter TauE/SafE family protein [Lederbergia panacisoli]MCR2822989.1 sulfite exporter TauE/SafE family protein [Lederbergia panacisoli]
MLHAFLIFIIALLTGTFGVIIGAGGGFIFVPALLLFFNMSPVVAAGTGIVVVMINSLSGIIGYAKQHRINYKLGIVLAVGATPGTFIGIWFNRTSPSQIFYLIFSIMILALGLFILFKKAPEENLEIKAEIAASLDDYSSDSDLFKQFKFYTFLIVGLLLGVVSGYLGIGGGWLLVPILIYIFGVLPHNATATSLFSLCLYSTIGVMIQINYGNIDWAVVLWGGIGVLFGAQLGVILSKKLSGKWIVKMLSVILIVVGIQLLFIH